jgi:hypothetical protein
VVQRAGAQARTAQAAVLTPWVSCSEHRVSCRRGCVLMSSWQLLGRMVVCPFSRLSGLLAVALAAPSPDYQLYQPPIAYSTVVSPLTSPLQYNHDSSIALFKSVWIAVWNANTNYKEGQPGQFNLMSTSADLKNWTAPARAFSDPEWSTNPVPCDLKTCEQWQPNLFMLSDGRLGCVWSGSNGRDGRSDGDAMITYFSSLASPDGKWTNHPIVFASGDGRTKPLFQGANWTLFASQNPTVLSSGRILAPVVMTSSLLAKDADPGCRQLHPPRNVSQMCFERRSSVLISDDHGEHWHESHGTVIPSATWAQWEPTVWAAGNGTTADVSMISRYNDFDLPPRGPVADRRMQRASSTDLDPSHATAA